MKSVFLRNRMYVNLFLSLGFALLLLVFRAKLTQSYFYFFLVWNLFLAGVPFLITQFMKYYEGWKASRIQKIVLFSSWLLFLPNSPYIITDLIHLHHEESILAWLDLFLVFVFAINGLLLGLLSLMDMHRFISAAFSSRFSSIVTFKICLLCGYGIYLGRFLRFNSWDVITRPKNLLFEVGNSLYEPKVWAITLAFGGLLWILFLLQKSVYNEYHRP